MNTDTKDKAMTRQNLSEDERRHVERVRTFLDQPHIADNSSRRLLEIIDRLTTSPPAPQAEGEIERAQVELSENILNPWARRLAEHRQGQSLAPLCEPPSQVDINAAASSIKSVMATAPFYIIGSIAALRSAQTPARDDGRVPERETWWLIERKVQPPQYVSTRSEYADFTEDAWRAVRFKTEREAFDFRLRMARRDECKETEHIFINKPFTAGSAPARALDALRNHQEQCDEDGVMVKVSRQALDETLAYLAAHRSAQAPARTYADGIEDAAKVVQDFPAGNQYVPATRKHLAEAIRALITKPAHVSGREEA